MAKETGSDIYEGRLVEDGYGNLLADEGDRKGEPVAYHEGSYIFIGADEPSHNERHHQQFAEPTPTQSEDPDFPGYAGEDADSATEGAEHHFDVPSEGDEPLKQLPDEISRVSSGHTSQSKGDE